MCAVASQFSGRCIFRKLQSKAVATRRRRRRFQQLLRRLRLRKDEVYGYMYTEASKSSRRCAFGEFESMAVAMQRRRRRLQQLLRRLRFRQNSRCWPAAILLGRCVVEKSKFKWLYLHCSKLTLEAMARTALRLRHNTSAWASWLPHWPTCMCVFLRELPIGFDSRFCVFFVFSTYCTKIRSGPMAVSVWLSCSKGEGSSHHHVDQRNLNLAQQRFLLIPPFISRLL